MSAHATAITPAFSFTLEGQIPPRRVPLAYRVGLGLTAFAMILLPLAYVAIVIAACYGIWVYAHVGTAVFEGSGGGIWRLIIYLGPLVAGLILVAFMVKPLFARPARVADPIKLDMDQQPQLRALITAICQQVGAPMPVRVDLDCQVNASARLRRGLLSLGRRDLVLTIGLPLIGGLSARQFAGVLAHEFGHFAQGASMGFTYVIRSINNWFARVVFERDEWDVNIHRWAQEFDIRIGIIFWLARGGIWISRKILHGLMLLGHAIACLQLRQMEFDADYYECYVAGSDDFAATSRELRRLGLANKIAFGELGELWSERKLVDDFPAFVGLRRAQLSQEMVDKLDAEQLAEKARWFNTHPTDLARCTHATRLKLAGNFNGDGPAIALFHQYDHLSRLTTQHFYREHLKLNFEERVLVSTSVAARTGDEANAADAARLRLAGTTLNLRRPLVWEAEDLTTAAPLDPPAALADQRARIAATRQSAEANEKLFQSLSEERENALHARGFLGAGVTIRPESFGLTSGDPAHVVRHLTALEGRIAERVRELAPHDEAIRRWVQVVVTTARDPQHAAHLPGDLAIRIDAIGRALVGFTPWFRAFPQWLSDHARLAVFAANAAAVDRQPFTQALEQHRQHTHRSIQQAESLAAGLAWPLAPAGETLLTVDHLRRSLEDVQGDDRVVVVLRTAGTVYFRLLGQIAVVGEELEKALVATKPDESSLS